MKKVVADANIVLRTLIDEGTELNAETRKTLQAVDDGQLCMIVPDIVIAECVWVMKSQYGFDRKAISVALNVFLEVDGIDSSELIRQAIPIYGTTNLDITDIYLSELAKSVGSFVLTWDKGFKKLDCEYYSPKDLNGDA